MTLSFCIATLTSSSESSDTAKSAFLPQGQAGRGARVVGQVARGDSKVASLSKTSAVAARGSLHMNAAFRARQSRLLT
jgi:hypothetical protein